MSAGPHLDEEALLAAVAGEASTDERAAIDLHLDTCARCRRVAAELVRADEPSAADEVLPGRVLDGYHVQRLLGVGAFSEVYRAQHAGSGRSVAIKVLKPELAGSAADAQLLLKEALAVGRIRHSGIAQVFEKGFTPGGRPYLVLELLEGETLEALLARRIRLPGRDVMVVLAGLLEPLAAAHRAAVLHRDLKPGNVFLSEGRVKLIDFGLAKQGVATHGFAAQTRGRIVGTPAYMAPEQAEPDGVVGAPTDLYAVGIMAYELLTGRVPFSGAPVTVMRMHARTPVPPLPADVSPPLAEWVMALLQKDPRARPVSAEVALAGLKRLMPSAEPATLEGLPPVRADLAAATPTERLPPVLPITEPMAPVPVPRRVWPWLLLAAGAAAAAALLTFSMR